MFIVASDLSEAQRERLTSSLSLKGIHVIAYTFDVVRTLFVELFCTPRSSIENPSLRVSGYGNDRNRSFLVGESAEDEYGQWATDEITGEQGYVDDERSCFWTWDDKEYAWQSRLFKGRQLKRRREKEKEKGNPRNMEKHFLAKNKNKSRNVGRQKRTLLGGSKAKERKALQKARVDLDSTKVDTSLIHKTREQARTNKVKKAKEQTRKVRARKALPHRHTQQQKHPMMEDMSQPGIHKPGGPNLGQAGSSIQAVW